MTTITKYLANMIDAAYEPDFIESMNDIISADDTVGQILRTTYSNADYDYLRAYAQTARDRLHDEIGY